MAWRGVAWRGVVVAVGCVLILTALLKAASRSADTTPLTAWVSPGWLNVVAVPFEFLLGAWLITGRRREAAWAIAVATFTLFAALSIWSGWVGHASCGCLGVVRVSPWWMAGFDALVLALLLTIGRPRTGTGWRVAAGDAAEFAVAYGLLLGAATAAIATSAGTADAAVAYLRGERVFLSQSVFDFGTVPAGEVAAAAVEVRNLSGREVRIVGGTSDCSCTMIEDLPVTIPAGGTARVTVRLAMPAGAGNFSRTATLWTDAPGHQSIPVALAGRSSGG